ncbi:hypothetical protein OFR20_04130 [Brachyspira hyodysenteriae]|uniref:hypothetical protein n=1 Tax=Brachyspira hyodysenteriae TaxID=159 RepID=UPI0022CD744C|nr:hypothetical protein [Brachyspira hyodysenteriae]MCZ9980710.1 hypothetical protein [Brachyspira hyodysenteriae]
MQTFCYQNYLMGDILSYFLNLNDRLKRKQLEDFIELFIERLKELNIPVDNIEAKEDFLYSMDLVFQNVVKNKSEYKMKIFRDILVNQVYKEDSLDIELLNTFLDIISKTSEVEIAILNEFYLFDKNEEPKKSDTISKIKDKFPKLTNEQYTFYLQNLTYKCLLYDNSMNRFSTRPFEIMEITDFGKSFY